MAGRDLHGIYWLLAAKAVCCGALLLAVAGGLSFGALAAWAAGLGVIWLIAVGLLLAAAYVVWRLRKRPL